MHIPIRRVDGDDLAHLRLINFKCTPGPGDAAKVEATIRGLCAEDFDGGALFAAEDAHLVVGVAVVVPTPQPGVWQIPVLAVRVPWQDRKIGRRLKHACLNAAYTAGARTVVSAVHTATAFMHRINLSLAGSENLPELENPGVVYSIDLEQWAAANRPDSTPQLFDPPGDDGQ